MGRTIAHSIIGAGMLLAVAATVLADGAASLKSGPIQATADGTFVWLVNPDHDSVTRLATLDNSIMEFALPAAAVPNKPRALAIRPGGQEVWVAGHESDRLYVVEAATGMTIDTIVLDHGSGPIAIAFAPDGGAALVALYRDNSVAMIDASTREVVKVFGNMPHKPLAIAFAPGGTTACVAHQFNDGDHAYLSSIDVASGALTSIRRVRSLDPKFDFQIQSDPQPRLPEGGWVFPTSQMAFLPQTSTLWLPVQLQNFRALPLTPDTVIQAAVLKIDTTVLEVDVNNRIVFSAVVAHSQSNTLLGDGWNAGVSAPTDIAFNADGSLALLSMGSSNDVLVVPTTTGMVRPNGAPALVEIPVGDNPIGLAWSPASDLVYVLNYLSRDVSVLDAATLTEIARVPAVVSAEPLDPEILLGAKIFHTSADGRASGNAKVSCASCHPGGETDGLIWDFSTLGAGRRKTLTMRGQALSMAPLTNGRGQLHRSGDRDELQDFEFTFAGNFMLGTGFIQFPAFPDLPLGTPNAGLSPELDAMSDFVLDLPPIMRSPHRTSDGALTESAVRGAMLYRLESGPLATGCVTCHPAPAFTDLEFHDVGGFRPQPDYEGPAFNTPSLVSTWDSGGFRQVVPVGGAAITRQTGLTLWDVLQSTAPGGQQPNQHGQVGQLSKALMRDLEAFLAELDGDLAAAGIDDLTDATPPRVLSVQPVSLNAVEVIFSEAVDPVTASDPANYLITDGVDSYVPSEAVVNAALGNRVRLAVPLVYTGCTTTYTLIPGPVADMAEALGAAAANVVDVNDPENHRSFTIDDGTITVTFGSTGLETFPGVAVDASFDARPGQSNTSHDRLILNPTTVPETKGFLRFDFTETMQNVCGVSDAASITDARFSLLPDFGAPVGLEVRRVLKPWGDPDRDNCISCVGAITNFHARFNTVPWAISGARSMSGDGATLAQYHPNQTGVDAAALVDGASAITSLDERVEFSGAGITDAFRFWLANPAANFGYMLEIAGTTGPVVEFWAAEAEGGAKGPVLSVTFTVPVTPLEPDCNGNGRLDSCDIALGESQDLNENGIPDECELPPCPADWNGNGMADVPDIFAFLADWFALDPAADFDGDEAIAVSDIFAFLGAWFAGCPM